MIFRIVLPVRPSAPARCWERRPLRSDSHRLGDLIFRQAFRPGEVQGASAVALRRPPIGRPDFLSGLPPRRGAGSVGRCAPTLIDWATRFSVRPFAPAGSWGRWPLHPDAYRLGDLIFCQAFRPGEVLDASVVAPRRPPIGRPDFSSGLPPRRGARGVGRCAPTLTDWATRFSVRLSASAGCWVRGPLRSDAHRLGDLIFRQAFRTTALRTAIPSRARKTTPTTIDAMSEIRALRR